MLAPNRRLSAILGSVALVVAACGGGGATTAPTSAATSGAATQGATQPPASVAATVVPGGLLDVVQKRGKLIIATDANYAPQSFKKPDGSFEGFDIDVGNELGKRLGVTVEFTAQSWDTITAGGWSGRWDLSVGSMTITKKREAVLLFSHPYYYTPAQMSVTTKSGITSLDGLAGKTVCVGASTTYEDWLKGTLDTESLGPIAPPPANVTVKSLESDNDCPEAIAAGQNVGEGFLSSITVVQTSIEAGTPIVKIGSPVYVEQLAVSADKSGPDPTDFIAAASKAIDDMHTDGTLTTFSMKWFKADLTKPPA